MAARRPRPITPELIRSALAYIPPDCDRDTWARVAMAIKSEIPEPVSFELWNEWSAKGEAYKATNARDTWRSVKAGGKTTIGTLFGIAKDHGFAFPDDTSAPVQTPARAVEEAARLAEANRKKRQAEEADYRARADRAAREALTMWANAGEQGASPYLQRKGVSAHGVRFLADGTLVVPMRNAAGVLQNLQRIAPTRPAGDAPEKRYLAGGRKSELCHVIGDVEGAAVLLLAEGYATGASLHESTGRPVAVCFDAGNLVHVAKALRERWPGLPMLVCGDDDRDTEARTRKNPGREKSEAAARAASTAEGVAGLVLPIGLGEGGSDFNDLAAHAGKAVVADQVNAAAEALLLVAALPVGDRPPTRKARGGPKSGDGGAIEGSDEGQGHPVRSARPAARPPLRVVGGQNSRAPSSDAGDESDAGHRSRGPGGGGGGDGDGDGGAPGEVGAPLDPFDVDHRGVWHIARDAEGNRKNPVWVCAPLKVSARTRADDSNGWGNLLEFSDPDGNAKTWAMPAALMSGEGSEWAGRLRDMGLQMAHGTRARNLVAQYINTRRTVERVTCTDRVGWHGPVYVLPSSSIAPAELAEDGRHYVFQSDSGMENTFRQLGTIEEWRTHVGSLAVGNSRLVFALACAFAGPTVRPAGIESGGFHFRGDSSVGKTTALKVAASVWGRPTYVQRWRTTDNALEAIAVQHCDCLLILDELGQLDPKVAGECAYMLANESEKGRATRGAMLRKRRTWRVLFLSSGEISLADHMAEAGKRTRAGMEVRMLDVPLDAGAGMGGLEALHGAESPGEFADALVSGAARQYGTAGRAWLEWLANHFAVLPGKLQALVERCRDDMVPAGASEQVRRAATRFALVGAAGELATEAGITGWPVGEAANAARQCFNAWLGARGHMGNGEELAAIRRVRQFLELNGEGRFTWWHRSLDDHSAKTLNRAGFRRLLGPDGRPIKTDSDHQREYGDRISMTDMEGATVDYIVLREVFEGEVCKGMDPKFVARLLLQRGHLQVEEGRLMDRQRLPGLGGDKVACYHIKPSIFSDEL
jgi:putative DNA primase/helicase